MTVEELIQQLVKQAQAGRGQFKVDLEIEGCGESFREPLVDLWLDGQIGEVVLYAR